MVTTGSLDYVVVGGGAAGLLLAARLTEDPEVQVLVLEAGEDLTADPRVNVIAIPQKALAGRRIESPQGCPLGGSAALNTMLFIVSSKSNLGQWAELRNQGWDWESLSKSLEKVYNLTRPRQPHRR